MTIFLSAWDFGFLCLAPALPPIFEGLCEGYKVKRSPLIHGYDSQVLEADHDMKNMLELLERNRDRILAAGSQQHGP